MLVTAEELLRRLALDDQKAVRAAVATGSAPRAPVAALEPKTAALVHLGALLAVGAGAVSCRAAVDVARQAGATDEELVAVLVTVGPALGTARVVTAAPRLALAIDYDVEGLDDVWEEPS